jgi:ribose-phosphate pyrophosphokinase
MSSLDVETRTISTSLDMGYDKRMMVAAGRASRDLGAKIASKIGVGLTDAGLKTFTDGEVYCRYAESIRGADLFIVQSIVGNEPEGVNVNDTLMELLVMIDAAVGASAHRVIAVTPWYGYSRRGSWRRCSRPRGSTGSSRWTCTPARCRASSRRPSTT